MATSTEATPTNTNTENYDSGKVEISTIPEGGTKYNLLDLRGRGMKNITLWNPTESCLKLCWKTCLNKEGEQTIPPCSELKARFAVDVFECVTIKTVEGEPTEGYYIFSAWRDAQGVPVVGNDSFCIVAIPSKITIDELDLIIQEPPKKYSHSIEVIDPDNPKKAITLNVFTDTDSGLPCYFAMDDTTLSSPLTITNFTMSNQAGLPQFIAPDETGEKSFEWCPAAGSYTYQDILDEAIAQGLTTDGGATPDGLLEIDIQQEYKGQQNAGKQTSAVGTEINGNVNLDGGQKFCEAKKYLDEDCDGKAAACIDLTTAVVVPAGAGHIIRVVGVICDADDNDNAV